MATFAERFQKLCLSNVEEVGTEIGRGSYGVVQEMRIGGLKVVGKTLFDHLQNEQYTRGRFEEECIRMSEIRHPNTVEFLGVYFKPRTRAPILVMEFLPLSLKAFLENQKNIPPDIKYSILYDVSLGLFHLHRLRPPVIHRDLTVNNVLLTFDLRAKIADFGVSRIITPSQMTSQIHLTTCPGLAYYMPPEALVEGRLYPIDTQHYDKLDIFSFGALILHVWTQEWPVPSNPFRQGRPLTEVQRRECYLKEIEDSSLLRKLTVKCLQNDACDRPAIDKVSDKLSKLPRNKFRGFSTFLEVIHCLAQKESEIKTVSNQCCDLTKQLQEKEQQMLRKKQELYIQEQKLTESWTELEINKERQEEEFHSQQQRIEHSWVQLEAEKSSQKKKLQTQELQLDNQRAQLKAYTKWLEKEKQIFNNQKEELHSQQQEFEHSWAQLEADKKRQKEEFHSQQQRIEHSWVQLEAEKSRVEKEKQTFNKQEEELHSQQRELEHSRVQLEAEKESVQKEIEESMRELKREKEFLQCRAKETGIMLEQQKEMIVSQLQKFCNEVETDKEREDTWYKADCISRAELQQKYPDASRFSKTDGNVAAIDFGTTFCSLAFVTVGNPDLVDMRSVEINTVRLNSYYTRVPTVILLRELDWTSSASCDDLPVSRTCNYKVVSFGYDAMTQLCSLRASQRSKYLYFERFKMTLQRDENVNRNMIITSMDGRKFYLVEVIAFVLKYLKHKLQEHLSKMQLPLKSDKFDWVITVPAIWKARGKRMMREAAYMAGLTSADLGITSFLEVGKGVPRPPETNPDQLTLALEPEAAAIHCQTLPLRHLAYQSLINGSLQSDRYVVINIGGGTVDVTVHRHDQGKGVRVITPPAGNACGGTMVNREFSMFLQEIVEDKPDFLRFIDSGNKFEQKAVLNALLNIGFEVQKVSFGDSASGYNESLTGDNLFIKLPTRFTQFYGIDKICAGIAALNDNMVELEDDVICIAPSKFASFFAPAIQSILECIVNVFEKIKEEVDTVYLVGGFGGCKYTYEKIASMMKDKFPHVQIIVPKDLKLAVVLGAVKYRLKPDVIHAHVMDASYGICLASPIFNPLIHDFHYKVGDTAIPRVGDVFMQLVEKGEHISSSDIVVVKLSPVNNAQTSMCLCLYGSFEKEIKYITTPDGNPNPSIRKIGELNVDMPNPDNLPREKRQVELVMDFSHTEIQIRARYSATSEVVKVVADFLSSLVSEETDKTVFSSFLSDLTKKLQENKHQVLRQKEELHFQEQKLKESRTELETKSKRQEEEFHSQQRKLEQSRVELEAEKSSQKKKLQTQELRLDNYKAQLEVYRKRLEDQKQKFNKQEEELHSQQQKLEHSMVELETEKKRQKEEFFSQQRELEHSWVELEAEKKRAHKELEETMRELKKENEFLQCRVEETRNMLEQQKEMIISQLQKLCIGVETDKERQQMVLKDNLEQLKAEKQQTQVEVKRRQKEELYFQEQKLKESRTELETKKKRQEEELHSQQQELEQSWVELEAEKKRRDMWHKADRISREELQQKYPDASQFSKTDGNVAAIDFGTTFCSLAFATVGNHDLVDMRSVEINTVRLNSYYTRVPAVILLRELERTSPASCDYLPMSMTCDYEVVSFGYDAMTQLCSLRASQRSKYLYFERFKMTLQQDENVNRNMIITLMDGRKFYLVEVIAFVLKYLKHKLEEHLSIMQQPLKSDEFDWVITVPALWKARGKRMMREAAYMAGLTSADPGITSFIKVGKGVPRPPETNPDKLTLALEPEAAAIQCQTLPLKYLAYHSLMNGPLQSDRYVVIDIGGGTVDVTVHRHDQEEGVRVITPPAGNACGGTMVDREFSMFLQEMVEDKPDFARFVGSGDRFGQMAVVNKLLQEFEEQKASFGDTASGYGEEESLTGDKLAIKLPRQFTQFYGLGKIEAGIAALNDDRVELEDDVIYIAPSKFASFFAPAIQGILECIEDVFEKIKEEVDTVYLVGGFGGCKYTYEKISSMMKTKFPQVQIIVPKDHKLAVAQGAVKDRLKPDVIHSRVMDASYGMDLLIPPIFNPLIHDSRYKVDDTDPSRVRDVLMRLVEKGEQISSNDILVVELSPINNAQTSMCLGLYASFEKEIKYITMPDGNPNPSICKLGELIVTVPNPDNFSREERRVVLMMDFSHTEIQFRARFLSFPNEELKVIADFLSTQVSEDQSACSGSVQQLQLLTTNLCKEREFLHQTVFPSFLRSEYEYEQIRPATFDVYSWKRHGGLVAKRKLKLEAGISTEHVHIQIDTLSAVSYKQAVSNLPPEDNIAALDFGTTYCSLAFTTVGDDDKATCLKLDTYRCRIPNAILLHKLDSSSATAVSCEIRAFGNKAQAMYTRLRPNEINQHLFFERIKMNLQHDPGVHREMTVRAQDGSQWYLIEVIAFMIRHVKDWLEDQLSRSTTPLKTTDFNWVITVPAIWQARGRGMMREAAYMAGLCSYNYTITCLTKQGQPIQRPQVANPECLTLAPEPDAAALYCQHMTETGQFAEYCKKTSTDKSQKYVVIDIGGGTVDITAQKVLEDGSIDVIQAPTGNSWGGTAVNRELVKLVQGIVGEEGDPFNLDTAFPSFFQDTQIRAAQKAQVVEAFYDGFEGQKEIFSSRATLPLPTDDDQHISFVIPSKFFEHYRVQFDRFANENKDKRIELEDDTLFMSYHCAKQLFQPAIDNILECTESVLTKLSGQVDTIFLVGGFGGCNYVYQHIKLLVSKPQFKNLRLIVPLDSKLAIALGAIRFWQPATKFVSRVVDASYGLAVSVPYCRDIHPPSHFKCDKDGDPICTDVFLTFVNEGEIAKAGEVAVEDILALVDNARTVVIPIYRSYTPALKYIWEIVNEQVTYVAHKVGELVIDIPESDITHRSQHHIQVMFDFSGPNMKVFACYMHTGNK